MIKINEKIVQIEPINILKKKNKKWFIIHYFEVLAMLYNIN